MYQPSSPSVPSPADKPLHKRNRVLLSCAPCRNSKLKCDRRQPCSQCEKKARVDKCVYAPKPVKKPAARNMTARLKRLEGLVRDMMGSEGEARPHAGHDETSAVPLLQGHVVKGERGTTYVGATHCLAMLEDIEDLQMYFDESEDEGASPTDELDAAEMLLNTKIALNSREDLIAQLPERHVADRLITRYFSSMSPSQPITHRPTFTKMYSLFWQDPNAVPLHWIAQVFMMLALGTFYNNFTAPHELSADSPVPVFDRIKHYRSCASWALAWGKYMQPTSATLPAFLLYLEAHFILDRATQMNCYVLSGVCMRLIFKMGLHRDPSKLANMSPFEGEMRRRLWNMALQIELLVSFHMGLPSMLQGIETDTQVPSNLQDEDFGPESTSLPPGRPASDYTPMTYPIHKTKILKAFGLVARQAHSLSPPAYSEVLGIDAVLQETWGALPPFMRVRPLEECVGDSPILLIQRFGLAAIYNKCRCVLHRRYLAEPVPNKEHNYSRQQGIDAAVTLLEYQLVIWKASKPGNVLHSTSWFLSSLAVHDFLLAAMIAYMVIQNDNYPDGPGFEFEGRKPSKEELGNLLRSSHVTWSDLADSVPELRKTADTLAAMLNKLGDSSYTPARGSEYQSSSTGASGPDSDYSNFGVEATPFTMPQPTSFTTPAGGFSMPSTTGGMMGTRTDLAFDPSWMQPADNMDWRFLDVSLAQIHSNTGSGPTWVERLPLDELDMSGPGAWGDDPPGV